MWVYLACCQYDSRCIISICMSEQKKFSLTDGCRSNGGHEGGFYNVGGISMLSSPGFRRVKLGYLGAYPKLLPYLYRWIVKSALMSLQYYNTYQSLTNTMSITCRQSIAMANQSSFPFPCTMNRMSLKVAAPISGYYFFCLADLDVGLFIEKHLLEYTNIS